MEDSILNSIKKMLGVTKTCTDFDIDIITHINTALMQLNQLGIGEDGFQIENKDDSWEDFIDSDKLSAIKTYVYLKVKLLFDPPHNSSTIESIKESIRELEWRLNVRVESECEEV